MARAFDQIGAAIPLDGLLSIARERGGFEEEEVSIVIRKRMLKGKGNVLGGCGLAGAGTVRR